MPARFELAITGSLKEFMDQQTDIVVRGTRAAVRAQTDALKGAAREEVRRAFFRQRGNGGYKLSRAVQSRIYENPDGSATGLVYSKFGRRQGGQFIDYFALFARGSTIRPRNSKYLVIPLNQAFERRYRRGVSIGDMMAADPRIVVVPADHQGALWLLRKQRGKSVLLAKMVRRVTIRSRLDFETVTRRAEAEFPRRLAEEIQKAEQRLGGGGSARGRRR